MRIFLCLCFLFLSSVLIAQYGGPGECPGDGEVGNNDPIREREEYVFCSESIIIYDEFGIPIGSYDYHGSREACVPTRDPVSCASWQLSPYCVPSIP